MIRTIKPDAANIRTNAGKIIALSPVIVAENDCSPSVQRLRTNAGKSIATTPSVVTETVYQPPFQAIRKNAGKVTSSIKQQIQSRIYAYFPLSNANKQSGYNSLTTLSGSTASYVTGKVGNCANFTGSQALSDSNQRIKLSDLAEFSVSFWFKPASNSGFGVPISKGSGGSISQWELHCFHSNGGNDYGFYCAYDSSNFRSVGWTGFTINNWWHCIFEFSAPLGRLALYVNDDLKQEVLTWPTNTPLVNYNGGFRIGGTADGSFFFNGLVDEVAIILGNTTQSERSWLYNSGNGNSLI